MRIHTGRENNFKTDLKLNMFFKLLATSYLYKIMFVNLHTEVRKCISVPHVSCLARASVGVPIDLSVKDATGDAS